MTTSDIFPAWKRILDGYRPLLSLEITKECPLRCPGCYAYEPQHLGGETLLRQLSDYRGDQLVKKALELVRRHRPIHISIVGGEPLVRYRELDALLPELDKLGIEVQLVTSAVRPVPSHWNRLSSLHLVVSIDGLPEHHDVRRTPATYSRILKHVRDHQVIVHCTITRQLLQRPGYLEECARLWSAQPEFRRIWFSIFTPQQGQLAEERLSPDERARTLDELASIAARYPKIHLPRVVLEGFRNPPASPSDCMFAQLTTCVSADLETAVTPCQFGGKPVCSECGCMASAGLASLGRYKLAGMVPIASLFNLSQRYGAWRSQAALTASASPAS